MGCEKDNLLRLMLHDTFLQRFRLTAKSHDHQFSHGLPSKTWMLPGWFRVFSQPLPRIDNNNVKAVDMFFVSRSGIGTNEIVSAAGIADAKCLEGSGFEAPEIPLACNGIHLIPIFSDDKINFPARCIPPVMNFMSGGAGLHIRERRVPRGGRNLLAAKGPNPG